MTYLLNPVEAILGAPDHGPASVHKTIVRGPCSNAIVPDGLGGDDGRLVANAAEGGTFDDCAPRIMGLNDLNAVLLVHFLKALLQVAARAKPTNEEDSLDSPDAALVGSLCDLVTN